MRSRDALQLSKQSQMIKASQFISHNVWLSTHSQQTPQSSDVPSTWYVLHRPPVTIYSIN